MTLDKAIQLIDEIASSYYPCDKKDALEMAIKALERESQTFEWCTDCREYDQEKHCCHRWSKVIRSAVEEMKQEPCEDAISREDALMCMTGELLPSVLYEPEDIISKRVQRIKALPPVQPKIKTGHWIKCDCWSEGVGMGEIYGYYYQCSECQKKVKDGYAKCDSKYCSNCGAKMIEPQESEDKE